jgi:hypothetical protein
MSGPHGPQDMTSLAMLVAVALGSWVVSVTIPFCTKVCTERYGYKLKTFANGLGVEFGGHQEIDNDNRTNNSPDYM